MKREIGTIEHADPALANHGTSLVCSVFARVIVGLLTEAQPPELEHLRVFTNDEPPELHEEDFVERRVVPASWQAEWETE